MRLTRNRFIVAAVLMVLFVSVYVDSSYVVQLFNPFNRSLGQLYRLVALVPVFPVEGGVQFSALASSPQSGSYIRINSSGVTDPSSFLAMGVYSSDPSAGVLRPFGSINWSSEGPIVPGESRKSPVAYLRNEGSKAVSLYFSTSGWVFRDAGGNVLFQDYRQYFSLTWNYDYSKIGVGEVRPVVFTLTVWPGIGEVSTFSFDLVITLAC